MKTIPEHHAVLVEGDRSATLEMLLDRLKDKGFGNNHPDLNIFDFEQLTIDDARNIIASSLGLPIAGDKKYIVVSFGDITREAQNALLKVLEEPSSSSRFVLSTTNSNILIPTLRSRLYIVNDKSLDAETDYAQVFLDSNISERLKMVEKMIKDYKDSGSKKEIREFLLSLISAMNKNPDKYRDTLVSTIESLGYLDTKGSSLKILLESVAIAV